jgi:helicase
MVKAMIFHGLFIGIDRHASPRINELSCAYRDAAALHALFTDTFDGDTALLTNEQATRPGIERHFEKLVTCREDDFVAITFSGHGSKTHELVTHDAVVDNLSESAIPLDVLTEWVSRIPARHLFFVLDCCFSGRMGAKVLHVDAVPRGLRSADGLLEEMSGEGRVILTASRANEAAWEDARLGHGLLTHHLIEALQGAEEVRTAGKIPIYRLLEYVEQRVISASEQRGGKVQHPTFRGQIDGAVTWPVFEPGERYRAMYPERVRPTVSKDIHSLAAYGFPAELLNSWSRSIPELNALQLDAINEHGVLNGEDLVVSAPTSSGKTMVGELAAVNGALERKRALFLFPLKALVNDKRGEFERRYAEFGLRVIRATGDVTDDIPTLLHGQYDICLMTYEKCAALILGHPHLLEQVGTIIVDEVQMISDPSRGTNLEFLITLIRMRKQQGIDPQLVMLSAVIGDTNGLERWLGARLLRRTERPVPLDEGVITADGRFRYIDASSGEEHTQNAYIQREPRKNSSQDWVVPLVRRLVSEGKQVIVFRETRGEARGAANYLAESLGLAPAQAALDALSTGDPSVASQVLRKTLEGGVAFHVSDLDRQERHVVEEQFRAADSGIRVIAATTTLAMGVNTPAEAVVIVGLDHPGKPPEPYPVAEYKNLVGRAGRLGFSERGASYLLALDSQKEHQYWSHYVLGKPEDIASRFLSAGTDPRSLILRVLAAVQRSVTNGMHAEDIVSFLEGSFGAFQEMLTAEHWKWDRDQIQVALSDLEQHEMAHLNDSGRYTLTELGRLIGQAGVEVESAVRLVEAIRPLKIGQINDPTIITLAQITTELDDVYLPINRKSTQKEPQRWMAELRQQDVPEDVITALRRSGQDPVDATLRAKRAAACLLWITDWTMNEIEDTLTQFYGRWNGAAGAIRQVASRTNDLLGVVGRIVEILHPGADLTGRVSRLLTRLETGVPSSAVALASSAGDQLTRADYLGLIGAGLSGPDVIEKASDEALLNALGRDAEKLREVRKAVERHFHTQAGEDHRIATIPPYQE